MTVVLLGRDGPGVNIDPVTPVIDRPWYVLDSVDCTPEIEWKFDGAVSVETPYPTTYSLGPKARVDGDDYGGGNRSTQFASDFAVGGAFFYSATTRNPPATWAPAGEVFQGYSAPVTGSPGDPTAWIYWGFPFDPRLAMDDIANPWAQSGTGYPGHPPPGFAGVSDDIEGARSGWRWRRGLRLKWTLPAGHEWGYVELIIGGRILCSGNAGPLGWSYRSYGAKVWDELRPAPFEWQTPPITLSYAEDIPPQGDAPGPWGWDPTVIMGWNEAGPFSWGKPATIQPLAMVGNAVYNRWNAGLGWVTTRFLGIDSFAVKGGVELPAGGTESSDSIGDDGVEIVASTDRESQWEAISTMQMRVAYPVAPGHLADELELVWMGAHPDFDNFTEMSLQARFYPVLQRVPSEVRADPPDHGVLRSGRRRIVGRGAAPVAV